MIAVSHEVMRGVEENIEILPTHLALERLECGRLGEKALFQTRIDKWSKHLVGSDGADGALCEGSGGSQTSEFSQHVMISLLSAFSDFVNFDDMLKWHA